MGLIDQNLKNLLFGKYPDDFVTITLLFMQQLGMSPEEARGSYILKCKLTGSPCNLCRGFQDSPSCGHGLFSVVGMTGKLATLYRAAIQEERYLSDVKKGYQENGKFPWEVISGKKEDGPKNVVPRNAGTKNGKEPTDDDMLDPFKGFPYDLTIKLSEAKIDDIAKVTRVRKKMHPELPEWTQWDERRKKAALGNSTDLAKRCSVNDPAWAIYTEHGENPKLVHAILRTHYLKAKLLRGNLPPEMEEKIRNALYS